jgi:hypothetical protein
VPFKAARLQSVLLFGRAQAALVMANPFSATLQLARAKPSHPLAQQRSQLSQSRAVCCEARAHKPPTHPSPSFGSQSVSQSESVYISKISQFHNLPVWTDLLDNQLGHHPVRCCAPRCVRACARSTHSASQPRAAICRFACRWHSSCATHTRHVPPGTQEGVCVVGVTVATRAANTLLVPSGHELGYQRRVDDVASCVCVVVVCVCVALSVPNYVMLLMSFMCCA